MTEYVCTEDVASMAGAPVPCDCGHLSAAYVLVWNEDRPSLRVCADCSARALRERYPAARPPVKRDPTLCPDCGAKGVCEHVPF